MHPRYMVSFLCLGLLALTDGCSPETTRDLPRVDATTEVAPKLEPLSPDAGGVAGYTQSNNCKDCHAKQYSSWHRTYHRTMTQLPTPGAVQGDFGDVALTNAGVRFVLYHTNDQYWVHMERPLGPHSPNVKVESTDVPLGLVTGSHHMQVYWVPNGMGNCQVGFPFTWLIPEKRWVPRNTTFLRPPTVDLQPETWNFVCARCHATAPQPNLDRVAHTWQTRVGEMGISCEACHGPGAKHATQRRENNAIPEAKRTEAALEIVHPEKIAASRASQICGFCHSMKYFDHDHGGWPDKEFSYRPGDDLEATTPVMRPNRLDNQPWLAKVLEKNPDIFLDFFWSDGMIRVSGREYNGLIESPCYKGEKFSCLSCHSMHQSEPDDLLARNRVDNRACLQCHTKFEQEEVIAKHTRHQPTSSGSECYNCHMPHTTYGVLSAIRSHQISSPKVADEMATGRPNACNLCHLDKTLAWTAGKLSEWFAQPPVQIPNASISDLVRMAIAGDAGQRALSAWHFGWEPAVRTSGADWIPPILARMMDDPYAAVRCVAERSLKRIAPELVPPTFDFTLMPGARPSIAPAVIELWQRNKPGMKHREFPVEVLVKRNDVEMMDKSLQELANQRDDRRVRLRE